MDTVLNGFVWLHNHKKYLYSLYIIVSLLSFVVGFLAVQKWG